jgi:hypothetical protein
MAYLFDGKQIAAERLGKLDAIFANHVLCIRIFIETCGHIAAIETGRISAIIDA